MPIEKETINDEALTFNIAVQNSNEASMLVYGCVCNVPEKETVLNFGATPKIIGVIWTKLDQLFDISTKYDVEKLLKTLYHVKRYPTDREMEHRSRKHAINNSDVYQSNSKDVFKVDSFSCKSCSFYFMLNISHDAFSQYL